MKEIKIGEKVYKFQEELRGLELIASIEDGPKKDALKTTITLISKTCQDPKMSYKDILLLPYNEFIQLVKGFADVYGVPQELDFLEDK